MSEVWNIGRALAKFYAALAAGGSLRGQRLLSPDIIKAIYSHQSPAQGQDSSSWGLGFQLLNFGATRGIGHPGMGGSIGLCSPDHQLAVGITVNRLSISQFLGEAGVTEVLIQHICQELKIPAPSNLGKPAIPSSSKSDL